MKQDKMRYVIRKYVMASSAQEAIRMDKRTPVDDCWVDEKWLDKFDSKLFDVGFNIKDKNNEKMGKSSATRHTRRD